MAEPGYLDDVLQAVAEDVRDSLAGGQPPAELVDEVFAFADTLLRALDEKTPTPKRRLPVCRPGCSSCCHLHAVLVSPLEALRLAAHVQATRARDELELLLVRLRAFVEATADMSKTERARARVPCPFLDEAGACGVHVARPLLCRGYNSSDLDACLAAFDAGTAETKLPCDANQFVVGKTLFAALLAGGGDARDAGPLELAHAVLQALETHEPAARWLAGEPVFSADATRISREAAREWFAFLASVTTA